MRTRVSYRALSRWTGFPYTRLPGSRQPFKHAIELHKKFIDTLASVADKLPIDQQLAVAALPPYESRGHGGRHRPTQRVIGGQWSQDRSKYAPTQGTREATRRVDHRRRFML